MTASTKREQLAFQNNGEFIKNLASEAKDIFHHHFGAMVDSSHATLTVGTYTEVDFTSEATGHGLALGFIFREPAGQKTQNPFATFAEKSKTTGDESEKVSVLAGKNGELLKHPVVGASSSTGMAWVYIIDNFTLSLTPATGFENKVAGYTLRHITGTTMLLQLFGSDEHRIQDIGGGARKLINLGSYDATRSGSGDARTGIELRGHGKIISIFAMIDVIIASGGSGSVTYNLEIEGINVTGGVVTIADADAVAAKKSGTAITALNEFHDGDLLDVEAVVGVANTSGRFDLWAVIEYQPGE